MMIVVAILALGFVAERKFNRLVRISGHRRHLASVHATSEQWFRNASFGDFVSDTGHGQV
jgi:hypothetical protein